MTHPSFPRIALLINDLNPGGAQKQSYYVARALHEAGADFKVYYTNWSERFSDMQAWGVDVVPYGRTKNIARRVVDLTRLIRPYHPDLIFSMRTYANLYAGVAGHLLRIPTLGTLRSTVSNEIVNSGRWPTRGMCLVNTALAVNSYAARDQLLAYGWSRPERVFVLPNVVDLDDYGPIETRPAGTRNIFFVGRLVREKNLGHLFRALAQARQTEPALRLVIVGDGCHRAQAEQQVRDLKLGDAVTFLGLRTDVIQHLKTQANMLVITSIEEGFPNVIIEAMAAGLPVITTPAGDSGIVVGHERTGIVVDFDDLNALAEALVRLWRDPDLCRQLGSAGRRKAEAQYSYAMLPHMVADVCQQVLALRNK